MANYSEKEAAVQRFTYDGTVTKFYFQFPFSDAEDLVVFYGEEEKALNIDYTATPVLENGIATDEGYIELVTFPSDDSELVIVRQTALDRETDFATDSRFTAALVDAEFDQTLRQISDNRLAGNSIKAPLYKTGEFSGEIKEFGASKLLSINEDGSGVKALAVSEIPELAELAEATEQTQEYAAEAKESAESAAESALQSVSDLKAAAISQGTSVDNIIYSTDTASEIPANIFVADTGVTYSVPSDAQGKFIDSIIDGVLTTTDTDTYTLLVEIKNYQSISSLLNSGIKEGQKAYSGVTLWEALRDNPTAVTHLKPLTLVNNYDFGCVGDNVEDDTGALNYWLASLRQLKTQGEWAEGDYRVTDELQFWGGDSTGQWGIRGAGRQVARIYYDFADAAKAVVNFNFDGQVYNRERMSFSGFSIRRHANQVSSVSPVGIDFGKIGNSIYSDISCHQVYNSNFRATDIDNPDFTNVESWNGGISFTYKDCDDVLFSNVGNTLTSSVSLFSSGDVGKRITIDGSGYDSGIGVVDADINETFIITAFNSVTEVALDDAPAQDYTDISCVFEAARASGVAGETTLTINSSAFTSDHVGIKLWVWGAGFGSTLKTFTVTAFNNSSSVEVDKSFISTFNDEEFAVCVFDVDASNNTSNDFTLSGVHMEHFVGVGVGFIDTTETRVTDSKIHGNYLPSSSKISTAFMWGRQVGLVGVDNSFDSNIRSGYLFRFSDQAYETCRFLNSYVVLGIGQKVLKNESYVGGGRVLFEGMTVRSKYVTQSDLIDDSNTSYKSYIVGFDNPRDSQSNVQLLAPLIQTGFDRSPFYYDDGTYTPSLIDESGNSVELTGKNILWTRIGKTLTVNLNFISNVSTASLVSTDEIKITLPFIANGNSFCAILVSDISVSGTIFIQSINGLAEARFKNESNSNLTVADFTNNSTDIIGGTLVMQVS